MCHESGMRLIEPFDFLRGAAHMLSWDLLKSPAVQREQALQYS